jgi:hypothetical protein
LVGPALLVPAIPYPSRSAPGEPQGLRRERTSPQDVLEFLDLHIRVAGRHFEAGRFRLLFVEMKA